MNIFKFDSPVMNFIGKVADMIILNLLCLICSIPIVTFGAAYTAKYYVSMKIIRGEEGTLFSSYFKAFASNFKQSTIAWLIQMVILAILGLDWYWIIGKGISNVNNIYLIAVSLITLLAIFSTMTIFPFIARFELKLKEAFKGAVLFSALYFIKLLLIVALEGMTLIASIWYGRWLPLILLFGTTTAFYFMNLTLIKGFKKLEAGIEKQEEEKKAEEEAEAAAEPGEMGIIRPDEHTLKGKLEAEKETIKGLTFQEKLVFFKDYYLGKVIIIVIVSIFALWFLYDAFLGKKEMIYSGGLLYCNVSEEGMEYLTDGLLDKMSGDIIEKTILKRKKECNLSDDLSLDFNEETHEVEADLSQEELLWPMIMAGYYDYFLIDAKLLEHYEHLDCYKDITEYANKYSISEEDCYFAYPDPEDETSAEGKILNENGQYINAVRLSDEVCEKIGVSSYSGEGVYLVLILNSKDKAVDDTFMEYIFEN